MTKSVFGIGFKIAMGFYIGRGLALRLIDAQEHCTKTVVHHIVDKMQPGKIKDMLVKELYTEPEKKKTKNPIGFSFNDIED